MADVAIYVRKSTESEDRQVLSIDSQLKELQQQAMRDGIKATRIFRESKSAKAPGRPIFTELLQLVNKGEIDTILCWKLDRLARNPVDGGALIWAMEEKKLTGIVTPQREFENTGNDKFWMQLEFGMAKKYVDDLSDNVKRGMRAKLEMGWQPGLAPFGYINDRLNHTIKKDSERFGLVRKMWELMLTGNYSPRQILDIATHDWNLRSRPTKKARGGPVAFSVVYKIFTNPFYYGAITFNGDLYEGSHSPMVTKREFDKVQYLLGLRGKPRPKRYAFLYTGLIKCGECGCAITAEHKTNQRYGYTYVYYHCTKRKRQYDCRQPFIEEKELEKQIAAFLDTITITSDISDWCKGILKELKEQEKGDREATLASQYRRMEANDRELGELLNCKLRQLITDEEYAEKRRELQDERFRIKELLADRDNRFEEALRLGEEAFDFAAKARTIFQKGSPEDKKSILRYTGSNLVLMDKNLSIQPQRPLFFIQKAKDRSMSLSGTFEPRKLSQAQRNDGAMATQEAIWRGCVEDVRTFLLLGQNNPCMTVPTIPKNRIFPSST